MTTSVTADLLGKMDAYWRVSNYRGPELAQQQKDGYPDLKPDSVNSPPDAVFPRALQAAKDMG